MNIMTEEERHTYLEKIKQDSIALLYKSPLEAALTMLKGLEAKPELGYHETLLTLVITYLFNNDIEGLRRWIIGFR